MSLQFIIGGSGSGKTRTLYENLIRQSMEEPDGRFFALVPEQFTMQTQKEIVMLHPNHGVMNIDIVSFERILRVDEDIAGAFQLFIGSDDRCAKLSISREIRNSGA